MRGSSRKRLASPSDALACSISATAPQASADKLRRVHSDVRPKQGNKLLKLTFPHELKLLPIHGITQSRVPTDHDGDAAVARRPITSRRVADGAAVDLELRVQCSRCSNVRDCGKQVWGASLLLAEYLWSVRDFLSGATVLELGAGLAIPSVCISGFCRQVIVSDCNNVALERAHAMLSLASNSNSNCSFMHLDWLQPLAPSPILASANASSIGGGESLCDFSRVDLVIASDVAYDPVLTRTFFVALRALLLAAATHAKALVTLERRINFSSSMCDIVALDADVFADYACGSGCDDDGSLMTGFSGRKLDVTRVPPFLFQQARCPRPRCHFEMWEIAHERLE